MTDMREMKPEKQLMKCFRDCLTKAIIFQPVMSHKAGDIEWLIRKRKTDMFLFQTN